jgi:hypothetical protein
MPIPTSDNNADLAAERIRQIAKALRQEAVKYIAQCDATAVNAHDLVGALAIQQLTPSIALWATLKAVTGVPASLRLKFPGVWASEAAVTTDLNAAQTVMENTLSYIVANTPTDGSGWVLTLKVTANLFEQRVVTAGAQITPLRAQLVLLRDAFSNG